MQFTTILRNTIRPALSAALLTLLIAGCSVDRTTSSSPSSPAISGNWQFTSTDPSAANLPQISGSISGTTSAFTATFHPTYANACVTPQTLLTFTGAVDSANILRMTSAPFGQGSVLTLTANYSGSALTNATYTIAGGTCAFASAKIAPTTGTQLQPISGNYQGTFTDSFNDVIPVTAALTQSAQPDANGIFHVTGSATFPGNPCLPSPVITDSTITGNTLSTTYTQQQGSITNTVVASGTFDATATTLTITNWTLTGSCGPDHGTGTLTHQ
jgi:hypothetical protein